MTQSKSIRIRGAGEHNLRALDVDIPRDQLVVITGVSGSGKSSLAFDTIFAEGQRKYMESLSAYARQFLTQWQKPDVESIEGLPPTIAIEQRSGMRNPRSTVATITDARRHLVADRSGNKYRRRQEPQANFQRVLLPFQSDAEPRHNYPPTAQCVV